MNQKTKATVYAIACVALWALIPVVSKFGQTELDHYQFLFWSSVFSVITLFLASVAAKKTDLFLTYTKQDWRRILGLGFLGTYLYYIVLYFGYARANGLEVLVLQYTWPVAMVVFSVLLLREKITPTKAVSIVVGSCGVLVILSKGQLTALAFENLYTDFLVLAGACVFALFSVLSKKYQYESATMVTGFFIAATIASFVSMVLFSEFTMPPTGALAPILLNGMLVNGYSYIFWNRALRNADAAYIAPFVFLTPIISTVYLVIFFNEAFLPIYILGLIAVLLAGVLQFSEKKLAV